MFATIICTTAAAVLSLSHAWGAVGQNYEIDWYTIDGGGVTGVVGSGYELSGTIGQHDAGSLAGGSYTMTGGFWQASSSRPTAPTVVARGPRYLEVIPAAGESEVALLVTSDDEPCVSLYVQTPQTTNGNVIGRLGASPVLLTPVEWGTVNVSDEAILPDTTYKVQSELAGSTLSAPTTATTWAWADANNTGGTVDFDDILCILEGFAGNFAGACSFFGSDLEGGVTNVTIDFDDILAALDAFAGDGYFDNPTHVDPCP